MLQKVATYSGVYRQFRFDQWAIKKEKEDKVSGERVVEVNQKGIRGKSYQ